MQVLRKPQCRPYDSEKIEAYGMKETLLNIATLGTAELYRRRMETGCYHHSGRLEVVGEVYDETWTCSGSLRNSMCYTGSIAVSTPPFC